MHDVAGFQFVQRTANHSCCVSEKTRDMLRASQTGPMPVQKDQYIPLCECCYIQGLKQHLNRTFQRLRGHSLIVKGLLWHVKQDVLQTDSARQEQPMDCTEEYVGGMHHERAQVAWFKDPDGNTLSISQH
jgi:hypothetical protein